jgi:hypothetical protein
MVGVASATRVIAPIKQTSFQATGVGSSIMRLHSIHTSGPTNITSKSQALNTEPGKRCHHNNQRHGGHYVYTSVCVCTPRPHVAVVITGKFVSPWNSMCEGSLKISWTHLITRGRNFVEMRWRSIFRTTSLGKWCTSYNAPPTSRKHAADRWSLRN